MSMNAIMVSSCRGQGGLLYAEPMSQGWISDQLSAARPVAVFPPENEAAFRVSGERCLPS
jgi:hypothetical protein